MPTLGSIGINDTPCAGSHARCSAKHMEPRKVMIMSDLELLSCTILIL